MIPYSSSILSCERNALLYYEQYFLAREMELPIGRMCLLCHFLNDPQYNGGKLPLVSYQRHTVEQRFGAYITVLDQTLSEMTRQSENSDVLLTANRFCI